jgi:carbon monoxide dehydrogenase subunit G
MDMTGTRTVPAMSDVVWHALNDPETLKACIPGCESIDPDGENAYRMAMAAKVGPVSAKFTGSMRLADIDAPRSYTLRFEGSGGAAGFVKGEAHVMLVPDGAGTTLTYTAKAQVGGKLAQVGSRLIDGVARKMADDFFSRFVAALSRPGEKQLAEREPAKRARTMMYLAIAAVVVVLLLLLVFRAS